MPLTLTVNGHQQVFESLDSHSNVNALLEVLGVKVDRVAVELNGVIAPRGSWQTVALAENDRVEMVHFVGGGAIS